MTDQSKRLQADNLPLMVSSFRVVTDQALKDGTKILQCKLSSNFRTADEAIGFRDQCGIDGAYIIQSNLFCQSKAEQLEIDLAVFGVEQA